ncbi:MAG TPA: DegT/DnrJ/EryC1/StrS family aminotransferase [Verrucomicrobiae bacterium]|nr:DegT/DnrJ/EryC1/StrS family aminotransferase [Verrucomicrobiae bacterium]
MNAPQTNPAGFVRAYRAEIDAAIARVLDSGRYILGPEVAAFEQEFAAFLNVPHAIGVASGTEALWLALQSLDLSAGDEVITVSWTATATVAAIVATGATPVFVDVCNDDLTMDPAQLSAALSTRTRAIVPVHLYGQSARMTDIALIATEAGVPVIEDAAQAHGARCAGRPVGTWGRAGAFSFYPTKNLGGLGDGGAIVTTDAGLAEQVRLRREYGWRQRFVSERHGWNSRLDEIQAAILRVHLRHLLAENAARDAIAETYDRTLAGARLTVPPRFAGRSTVHHQYVIRCNRRDQLQNRLASQGVPTAIHYPVPVHLQPAYQRFGRGAGSLPVTEQSAQEVLSLLIHPHMTIAEAEVVGELVSATLSG